MWNNAKNRTLLTALVALAVMGTGGALAQAQNQPNPAAEAKSQACLNEATGLKLPEGFCATVFADGIGHARHMVVAPNGVLYVTPGRAGTTAVTLRMPAVSSWPCKTGAVQERPM